MSDVAPAIVLRGATKVYRLYRRPSYRILDLLGLCPQSPAYFSQHAALNPIDLTIGRGEKVAVIGRNGAGKSTLLKLVTGATSPSGGAVVLYGRVSPLLQIGTGFHPDFTGRQNVFASLAHMGIVGKEAGRRFDDIVDFAELDEFIDQPMKTYSTGMAARLMFSTATAVEPEILVVDELLGVGDAYFSHKSFERMRQLCRDRGTTLLLVTHDLYSAMDLCERFVWIDRGQIRHEGDGRTTVAAYEASIKEQEEARLRSRNRTSDAAASTAVRVVVRSRSGFALPERLWLERIALESGQAEHAALAVAEGSSSWHLSAESNLGAADTIEGRLARPLDTAGRVYHKVEWRVASDRLPERVRVSWHYGGADAAEIAVLSDDGRTLLRGELTSGEAWQDRVVESAVEAAAITSGQYGSGRMRIAKADFLDQGGAETVTFEHGGPFHARLTIVRDQSEAATDATLVLAFNRAGTAAGAYIHAQRLELPATANVVDVECDAFALGSGSWLVTGALGEAGLYEHAYNPYFTVNDRWYHMLTRAFEIQVRSTTPIDKSAFAVIPATFRVTPAGRPDEI